MKKSVYLYSLLLSVLICSQSYALDPTLRAALEQIKIFPGFEGRRIYVYEDVDEIKIDPQFGGVSGDVFSPSSIPSYIKDNEKYSVLSSIVPGAFVIDGSLDAFISSNFYLEYGDPPRSIPDPSTNSSFPHVDDNNGQDPGTSNKYEYRLSCNELKKISDGCDPSSYISALVPNTSCKYHTSYCSSGCNHEEEESVTYNLISKSRALSFITYDDVSLDMDPDLFALITFRDRTPPRIIRPENEPRFWNR